MKVIASDVLYNGEATGFEHAMELVITECRDEKALIHHALSTLNDSLDSLNNYENAAKQCLAEYTAEMANVKAILHERWSKSTSQDIRMIAEAFKADEYSTLAV